MQKLFRMLGFSIVIILYYSFFSRLKSFTEIVGLIIFTSLLVMSIHAFRVSQNKSIEANASIDKLDTMSEQMFTAYIIMLYKKLGYSIDLIKKGKIVTEGFILTKDRKTIIVLCKKSEEKIMSVEIEKLFEYLTKYNCQQGIFITNQYYTDQAKELAAEGLVTLIDRDGLKQQLKGLNKQYKVVDEPAV